MYPGMESRRSHPGGDGRNSRPSTDSLRRAHAASEGQEGVPGMALQYERGGPFPMASCVRKASRKRRQLKGVTVSDMLNNIRGWRSRPKTKDP